MDPEHWQQEDRRGSIDSCFAQMPRSASAQMVRLAAATAQGCYSETGFPILSWIANFVLKISVVDPDPRIKLNGRIRIRIKLNGRIRIRIRLESWI